MRQLGGLDASFLYMETPQTPMHVGGLYLFELPAGYEGDFYDDFKAHVLKRMHLAPILSKKLSPMPLEMDHPVWVDGSDLDIDYHIRRSGLPKPGTMEQLEDLVGRLHSNLLDRSRPLWEFTIIDGLQSGHAVLYTKVHHAAIDGGAGMELTKAIYDLTPVPREVEPPQPKAGSASGREPNLLNMLGTAYAGYLRQQVRNLQMIPDAWKALAKVVLPDAQTLQYQPFAPPPLVAPKTILNGTITGQRVFAARSARLDDAKRIAKLSGAKLNDVVLAACAGALRRYLQDQDALPAQPLTAFVPVSLREAGNAEMNNQVFGMLCSLATDVAEPLARLRAIVESSQQAKQLTGNIKDVVPRDYSILGAPLLLQGLMGLYGRSKLADQMQLAANVTISNVPGPAVPLYAAGAKMLTMYPVSIPTHGVALNITVQSYNGALDFGLTTARNILPDVRKLTGYIVDALAELKAAASGQTAGQAPKLEDASAGAAAPSAGAALPVDAAPLAAAASEPPSVAADAPVRRQAARKASSPAPVDDGSHSPAGMPARARKAATPSGKAAAPSGKATAPSGKAAAPAGHTSAQSGEAAAPRRRAPAPRNEAAGEGSSTPRGASTARARKPPGQAKSSAAPPRQAASKKASSRSGRVRA